MKKISLIVFFSLLLLLVACDVKKNYNILSFFFDGVPNPVERINTSKTIELDSTKIKRHNLVLKKTQPNFIFHKPFKQRKCSKCHNVSKGFSLTKTLPELCYSCHKNFVKKLVFVHGPVDSGYCSKCHHPHKSKNEYMLLKTGKALCLQCHNRSDVIKNKIHKDLESKGCISCHNPHGSKVKYFLSKQ